MNNYENWTKYYALAKSYYEHYNNLKINVRFKTKNGYEYDEDGICLGGWIRSQRKMYNKVIKSNLDKQKIEALNKIGMIWKIYMSTNDDYLNLATSYYNHYGNLNVPQSFRTKNGYDYDPNGKGLGAWIQKQRCSYPNIDENLKLKLEEIKIAWSSREKRFDNMLKLATNYYNYYGNLDIPTSFKTKNGYEYDENGKNLGIWLSNVRRGKTHSGTMIITEERYNKLKEIGYTDPKKFRFEKILELLKNYYSHHENKNIQTQFKTKNGYEYDKDGFYLGAWAKRQIDAKKAGTLEQEKIDKLNEIGFVFEYKTKEDNWNDMLELATNYYNHYKDLGIRRAFKTKNGYEYDEDGVSLGRWIQIQRNSYRASNLSKERINELNKIGMIWNKSEYDFYNSKITLRTKKQILQIFKDYLNSINNECLDKENIEQINHEFEKKLIYSNVK